MKRIFGALILALICSPLWATTFYVDNCVVAGNDSNNGTSTATPWLTIAHVNGLTFSAGDSILFESTCTWREQLTVPSSGSAGSPITIGSYGSGALPIISGANLLNSGWTLTTTPGSNTVTASPGAADDTVWEQIAYTSIGNTFPYFGNEYSGDEATGSRFLNLAVPNAATITAASVNFTSWCNTCATTTVNATIKGEKNATPAIFSTSSDFLARTQTTASVAWNNLPTWTYGTVYTSPNISSVIQEIVNLGGWASGHDLVVFVNNNSSTNTSFRGYFGYADSPSQAPVLSVTYNIAAPANVWQATVTTQPSQVFFNGVKGTKVGSLGSITAPSLWYWAANVLYVYSTSDPASAFTGPGVEASARNYGIRADGKQYLTIQGIEAKYANSLSGSGGITLANNVTGAVISGAIADYNQGKGITIVDENSNDAISNVTVQNSQAFYNGDCGIAVGPWAAVGGTTMYTNVSILNNAVHHNSQNPAITFTGGISIGGAPAGFTAYAMNACHVRGNVTYLNGINGAGSVVSNVLSGPGIWLDTVENCDIANNQSYQNAGEGVFVENGLSNAVYSNLAWGNNNAAATIGAGGIVAAGIALGTSRSDLISQSNVVYNNTSYGNLYCLGAWGNGNDPATSTFISNTFKNNLCGSSTIDSLLAVLGAENVAGTYGQGSGNVYTFNGLGTASSNFIAWGCTSAGCATLNTYSTYATWEAATGNCGTTGCSHSIQTNPTFANAGAGQFWLLKGSAGIGVGTDLGTPYNVGLMPSSTWPSGVVTRQQSSPPTIGAYDYVVQNPPHPVIF